MKFRQANTLLFELPCFNAQRRKKKPARFFKRGKKQGKKSDLATRLQTVQVDNQKTGLKNLNHKGITKRGQK